MKVLLRDRWLLAVDKPAGLLTQPGLGPEQADSLITRLNREDPAVRLVHRLDRDTSGVLLLARGLEALRSCSSLFAHRRVNKLYLADVDGHLDRGGAINSPLARLQRQPPRYGFHPKGRPAITLWRVLRRLDGLKRDGITFQGITRVWLRPVTGRSHQLRAHLAGIGHPILGDPIYGDVGRPGRLRLHAHALSFRHPFTQERVRLISAPTFL